MAKRKPASLTIERYAKLARDRQQDERPARRTKGAAPVAPKSKVAPNYRESVDDEWV